MAGKEGTDEFSTHTRPDGKPPRRPFHRVIDGVPRCAWLDPDIFRELHLFRPMPNDVVTSTYPKSGTHWVHFLVQLILKGGKPVESYGEFTSHTHALEYMKHDDWKPSLPMRLFYSHLPLNKETMSKEAKYIYIARNPWDICVSFYHMMTELSVWQFQNATFEEFVDAFLETDLGYGSYFDHVSSGYNLRNQPNVLFITYEDLKRDTRGLVLSLARFLGECYYRALKGDAELLAKILEWSKPEFMRKIIILDFGKTHNTAFKEIFERNTVSCSHGYEGDKNKYAMVRTANVGGWKEYFTSELLARLEKKIQEEGDNAAFIDLWKDIREEAIAFSKNTT
ncbi:3-alpha-hydroxysteroid sulfotransferase-like isoform X1 [Dermacentor albipictus]|uniref:3-alpha-hydroxysteroid sulfotransferase-like isoform X1 n=2 Tax=Dermacentor albipictus TaxID=60249 RepID=UPI0038FC5C27